MGRKKSNNSLAPWIEFLNGSSALEGIDTYNYADADFQKNEVGYYGAFKEALEYGINKQPLTIRDISHWQSLTVREQLSHGYNTLHSAIGKIRQDELPVDTIMECDGEMEYEKVYNLLEYLITNLNRTLQHFNERPSVAAIASLLGDFYQEFEALAPYSAANGRIGRLLVNFITSWIQVPIIIFRAEERSSLLKASRDHKSMRCFMAEKLQEAVYNKNGVLLTRVADYGSSAVYKNPEIPGQTVVEWHELLQAVEQWKADNLILGPS